MQCALIVRVHAHDCIHLIPLQFWSLLSLNASDGGIALLFWEDFLVMELT